MELKKQLGENIKNYRKINKLTQEKLAEKVGVEIISISSIETGRYFPTPENLVKISEALNVKLADLFEFRDKLNSEDYLEEIYTNLKFLSQDKTKLCAISGFIKNILLS